MKLFLTHGKWVSIAFMKNVCSWSNESKSQLKLVSYCKLISSNMVSE